MLWWCLILVRCLFLHGVRSLDRVRLRGLHRQEDSAAEKQVWVELGWLLASSGELQDVTFLDTNNNTLNFAQLSAQPPTQVINKFRETLNFREVISIYQREIRFRYFKIDTFRFLAMQKLAEEKKAEALKAMGGMPQELDLKRHGPDGYGHCRDGRGMSQNTTMPRQHPKQVDTPPELP